MFGLVVQIWRLEFRRLVFSSTKNGWPGSVSFFTYILWLIFLFRLRFIFPLFLGMVLYANEFKTKEKQKLTEIIKKKLTATYVSRVLRLHLFSEVLKWSTGVYLDPFWLLLGHDSIINNLCVCFFPGCSRESRKETVLNQKISNSS